MVFNGLFVRCARASRRALRCNLFCFCHPERNRGTFSKNKKGFSLLSLTRLAEC
jgi:hypothetical protein